MPCLLLLASPSISLWPHTVQGCDAAQRSSQRQQRASSGCAPTVAPHLSPCLRGKHETEKICGAHAHSFPTAHESHNCLPPPHHHHQNPSNLQPRASEEKHRSREGVIFIVPVCMFTSLIHSGRSGGGKKNNVLTEHNILVNVLPYLWSLDFIFYVNIIKAGLFLKYIRDCERKACVLSPISSHSVTGGLRCPWT